MGIGATLGDRLVDRNDQPLPVVGVNGCNNLRQAQTILSQGWVQPEAGGERRIHREPVGGQFPHPGADDRTRPKRDLNAFDVFLR
jgi:hypothetical protein